MEKELIVVDITDEVLENVEACACGCSGNGAGAGAAPIE